MAKYLLIVLMLLPVSCMSIQKKRLNYIESHPNMTQIQKEAMIKGEVVTGMNREMVEISWGKPRDIIHEDVNGRRVTKWYYIKMSNDRISGYEIVFRRDVVMDVRYKGTYSPGHPGNTLHPFR